MVRAKCLFDIKVVRLMHQVQGAIFILSAHLDNLTAAIGTTYLAGMMGQNRAVALGAGLDFFGFQSQMGATFIALGTGVFLCR